MVGVRWESHTTQFSLCHGPNVSAEDPTVTESGSLSESPVTVHICTRDFTVHMDSSLGLQYSICYYKHFSLLKKKKSTKAEESSLSYTCSVPYVCIVIQLVSIMPGRHSNIFKFIDKV